MAYSLNVSGIPAVGYTLTANVSPSSAMVNYQWYRNSIFGALAGGENNPGGFAYQTISGATSNTYTPNESDIGYYIICVTTGTGSEISLNAIADSGAKITATPDWSALTGKTIPVKSQLAMTQAIGETSPVRKTEFDLHANAADLHLPSGGTVGQVLTMTASGPAWVTP